MEAKEGEILAWHCLAADRRLGYGDGRIVEADKTYSTPDSSRALRLCLYGMHASRSALNALSYAPGPVVSRVALSGEILEGDDKLVARNRRVLWIADATDALWDFARSCALDVIDLWDAPDVVREYLETGDEDLRAAARDAAEAARAVPWGSEANAAKATSWAASWVAIGAEIVARAAAAAASGASWVAARETQSRRLNEMLLALAPKG